MSSLSGLIQEEELKGKETMFMSKWLRKTISTQETDTHNQKTQQQPPKLLCYFAKILPKKNWAEHLNAALATGGGRGRRERNMIYMSHSPKVQMHGGLWGGGGGREFISFEFDALLSAVYCKMYQAD